MFTCTLYAQFMNLQACRRYKTSCRDDKVRHHASMARAATRSVIEAGTKGAKASLVIGLMKFVGSTHVKRKFQRGGHTDDRSGVPKTRRVVTVTCFVAPQENKQ